MTDARYHPTSADALVIVDVQNDFLSGGALAVPDGDAILEPLNRVIAVFEGAGLPIFATRDWHPVRHCSFRQMGGPWPPHCVAETGGAAFPAELLLPPSVRIVSKGRDPAPDAYSGFQGTQLAEQLRAQGCHRLFVGGLATDYCVRATVDDALTAGFDVVVLQDAVKAVNLQPEDGAKALAEMRGRGARIVSLKEVLA